MGSQRRVAIALAYRRSITALQIFAAVLTLLVSMSAHAGFCPAGYVPTRFGGCAFGNVTVTYATTPCESPSVATLEAAIQTYNPPGSPYVFGSWYSGGYYYTLNGVTGWYLVYFLPLINQANPGQSDQFAYAVGADQCTTAQYFATIPQVPAFSIADQGSSCPFCKNDGDPVNPSSGGEFLAENDVPSLGSKHPLSFQRYYNSLDATSRTLGPGWRQSFSRHLTFGMSYPASQPPATGTSSLYSSQSAACTSGWTQIQNQTTGLQNATASFSNGVCSLSLNGSQVGTLPVYDNSGQYVTFPVNVAVVNAYRDDGHVINFTAGASGFTAEAGVGYRLVTTASGGYQLIDE